MHRLNTNGFGSLSNEQVRMHRKNLTITDAKIAYNTRTESNRSFEETYHGSYQSVLPNALLIFFPVDSSLLEMSIAPN